LLNEAPLLNSFYIFLVVFVKNMEKTIFSVYNLFIDKRRASGMNTSDVFRYLPLTPERWADFEQLFEPNGNCSGCWCTWWRLSTADFRNFSHEEKKNTTRTLVQSDKVPGLLAFVEGTPAGWVAFGPREEYPRLERSRVLARVDDKPVWCINCFFIDKHYRRQGLMAGLIHAAIEYAHSQGAQLIEAYPVDPHPGSDSGSLYHGVTSVFVAAGFVEAARRSEYHPLMRLQL
jgi:GNAT superfamily N-acetyltransferase